jgi:hypothetical protein
MKKVYSYKGEINQDLISVDTANIKVFDYIQSIDSSQLSEKEQELLSRLTIAIVMNDATDSTTFSDVRFSYLFINMMLKNKSRIKISTIVDFIVYYQYLITFYNKEVEDIDSMIRFVNLFIGYTFQKEKVSKSEIKELSDLAKTLVNAINEGKSIAEYTPEFVYEAISMANGITEAEWKMEASKEDIVIEPKPSGYQGDISEEDKDYIEELKTNIETVLLFKDDYDTEESIQEALLNIDTWLSFIKEITGEDYQVDLSPLGKMEIGGIVQSYTSPALLQFNSGGLVERFSSPLPQTPKFGGEPKMFNGGGRAENKDAVYIEYLNKDKRFQKDRMDFDSYEEAVAWGMKNLGNFNSDMIRYKFKKGGKIGFNALAKKVAAAYKGKRVKAKYQSQYGKTYSAAEAKEVGNKVAAKVYRAQLKNK